MAARLQGLGPQVPISQLKRASGLWACADGTSQSSARGEVADTQVDGSHPRQQIQTSDFKDKTVLFFLPFILALAGKDNTFICISWATAKGRYPFQLVDLSLKTLICPGRQNLRTMPPPRERFVLWQRLSVWRLRSLWAFECLSSKRVS